jgi:seryl-tRNA synthetase
MTETTKPNDRLSPQERLDQIRLFQARHTITVQRLLNKIKSSRNPQATAAARDELDRANQMADALLEERNQLEVIIRDQRQAQRDDKEKRDAIRQIVCSILSNSNSIESDQTAIVSEAMDIEDLIQSL